MELVNSTVGYNYEIAPCSETHRGVEIKFRAISYQECFHEDILLANTTIA
jgi:hypothetical protein